MTQTSKDAEQTYTFERNGNSVTFERKMPFGLLQLVNKDQYPLKYQGLYTHTDYAEQAANEYFTELEANKNIVQAEQKTQKAS